MPEHYVTYYVTFRKGEETVSATVVAYTASDANRSRVVGVARGQRPELATWEVADVSIIGWQ